MSLLSLIEKVMDALIANVDKFDVDLVQLQLEALLGHLDEACKREASTTVDKVKKDSLADIREIVFDTSRHTIHCSYPKFKILSNAYRVKSQIYMYYDIDVSVAMTEESEKNKPKRIACKDER